MPIVVLHVASICNLRETYIRSRFPISLAKAAITSEVIPRAFFRISSPLIILSSIVSRNSPIVSDLILSYSFVSRSPRIILVTASSFAGTAGSAVISSTVKSLKTSFAAIRSLALAAAIPASESPLFCSLALAKTSLIEENLYLLPKSTVSNFISFFLRKQGF